LVALFERNSELAAVAAVVARGGVLIVEGGAGMGKTALLGAACERAGEAGSEVLRARGSELEAGFAFGVVRQLFERRLSLAEPSECEALLSGPAAAARPLLSGQFVENIHADGPNVFAHELYVLNGATPNSSYQVMLSIWVSNLACSESPALTIHPADLQTNASGNGQADRVFTPQNVEQAGLLGQTVSATWLLSAGGSPGYQTGCEVVTLN
jgi:hypothetical protein